MDESNIPIDINIGKLQDWLVSRRHVIRDWQPNVLAVREKINNAIQDMPAHDGIVALLSGTHINYFHCIKIVEILKETEADTKNLFGRYGSQRMKDWLDVIKSYEKENLYLAEAAQILVRNINYEIPSLKKQIAKEEQLQTENEKKVSDYKKNEASMIGEFQAACKQLGIEGKDIKKELISLLKDLPEMYNKLVNTLPPILPAMDLYTAFCRYMKGESADPLPLLKYVAQRGNVTVYEWTYGEAPLSIEQQQSLMLIEAETSNFNEIDFGSVDGGEIDFGEAAAGEVDFGDGNNAEIDFGEGEIEWGGDGDGVASEKDLSSAIAEISLEESGIVVESGGTEGGVARGREAFTLLDNPTTKAQIIEQIVELESFLKMRLYESSSSEGFGLSLMPDLPSETTSSLAAMLDAVQISLALATDVKLTHLHNVKHSPRYIDVLSAQLQQKLTLCDKLRQLEEAARGRALAASDRQRQLAPSLAHIVAATQRLQAQIEADISKKYKGRPVNIIGGVKFL